MSSSHGGCRVASGRCGSNVHAEGDVAAGQRLAQEICSRCHNVEPQGSFKQVPPSFASIAAFCSTEQIRWRVLFPPLHSSMPQIYQVLSLENVDNLVAYISSLEGE